MARTLVTGATGFVGRNLVEHLRARGDDVRCLVRPTASPATLAALTTLGAELVLGDVTDPASLATAVQGVDVVYQVAGLNFTLDKHQFHRVNVDGPRNVVEACAACERPPILIAVSSLAAAGPSPLNQPRSEEKPPNPVSIYGRSKWQGEVVLHRFADHVPITIVRPPGVFGPWDVKILEAFQMVRRGVLLAPGWAPQQMALVSVSDFVEVLPKAVAKGQRIKSGEGPDAAFQGYYFIAHPEQPTFTALGGMIAEALGRRRPLTLKVPFALCWGAAGCVEVMSRLRGQPGTLNFDKMREATGGSWICRTDRVRDELGFRPKASLLDQLRDTARWYSDQKWL